MLTMLVVHIQLFFSLPSPCLCWAGLSHSHCRRIEMGIVHKATFLSPNMNMYSLCAHACLLLSASTSPFPPCRLLLSIKLHISPPILFHVSLCIAIWRPHLSKFVSLLSEALRALACQPAQKCWMCCILAGDHFFGVKMICAVLILIRSGNQFALMSPYWVII